MATRKTHSALLALLKEKENAGEVITLEEILAATGWKRGTFLTYLKKGQFSPFLNEQEVDIFVVSSVSQLTDGKFSRMLSQSKHRRELGHKCKSRLAKALLRKSRDNMLLALELYNRPSLDNRMDGFVLCFCTAWEQLLKAMLIEKNGEPSIFKPNPGKKRGIRETISLRECLERQFEKANLVRRNIDRIAYYRDQAVHLLMPEIQGQVSRLFQSGVMNYGKQFEAFAEQDFMESSYAGLMSLVGDLRRPDTAVLKSRYGDEVGEEVAHLVNEFAAEAKDVDDIHFAVPVTVKLVFTKNDEDGNVVALSDADEGMEGLRQAVVIEKPVDPDRTHPYRQGDALKEINARLRERYLPEDLQQALPSRDEAANPCVNSHDFQAAMGKLKWKSSNNQHHYKSKNPEYHKYSEHAIEEFVNKVMDDKSFLARARESHRHRLRKAKFGR